MKRFWCSGDSTSKRVLDVLEFFYLRLWKIHHSSYKINDTYNGSQTEENFYDIIIIAKTG